MKRFPARHLARCLVIVTSAFLGGCGAHQRPQPKVWYEHAGESVQRLEAIRVIAIAPPDVTLVIHRGKGDLPAPYESSVISQSLTTLARDGLLARGFQVVTVSSIGFTEDERAQLCAASGADALLVTRSHLFRNSTERKVGKALLITGCVAVAIPVAVFSYGICVPPIPWPQFPFEVHPSDLSLALVDGGDGKVLWKATQPRIGSTDSAMRRLLTIFPGSRRKAAPARAEPPRSSERGVSDEGSRVIVNRTDGRTYIGTIVKRTSVSVVLMTDNGQRIELPLDEISSTSRFSP